IGAISVGLIYQFYYSGGDTFAYHTFGSRIVWEALVEEPISGLKLLFGDYDMNEPSLYKYASRIWFFGDSQSYFVIRTATIFDILTFSTYSATAVLFAAFSFSGSWALFLTFYKISPDVHKWIAFSCLFIPTVCFWGSGIFKDTLTLAALGWLTYSFYAIFFEHKYILINVIIALLAAWVIFSIKKYILLSFLPALIVWYFAARLSQIRNVMAKLLLVPPVFAAVAVFAYFTVVRIGQDDSRYDVSQLASTVKITAYDIRYGWGARTGENSGYTLGELDGTWQSMIPLIPKAINVSLFRPYLWEVRNPLMLLSALESLGLLFLTIYVLAKIRYRFVHFMSTPEILFCFVFALVFAFAVGISTYNFGTLSRYKIPMMPFYTVGLGLLLNYFNAADAEARQMD
ncbi:MAG: hypothetical protein C0490_23440, partial [Marivirga sp.]|nr:hypothetical protein [Marivirga sp.]